jgi:hypothetical protein
VQKKGLRPGKERIKAVYSGYADRTFHFPTCFARNPVYDATQVRCCTYKVECIIIVLVEYNRFLASIGLGKREPRRQAIRAENVSVIEATKGRRIVYHLEINISSISLNVNVFWSGSALATVVCPFEVEVVAPSSEMGVETMVL